MAKCFSTPAYRGVLAKGGPQPGAPQPSDLDEGGVHVVSHHIKVGDTVKCVVMFQAPDAEEPLTRRVEIPVEDFTAFRDVEDVLLELNEALRAREAGDAAV